jgi:outer membrane lipoprotein-sorting protein
MKKFITLLFVILNLQAGYSQDKSKQLLDEVSAKIASYKNIQITFDYSLDNDKEKVHQKTSGNVLIQAEKYNLEFMGVEKIFDGKKIYNIVHEDEEVVISNFSSEDNDISPSKILSFYKKGYNYTWDRLVTLEGKKIQFIKLTPIKPGDVVNIMLGIDSQNKQIYQVEYVDKRNTKTAFKIRSFKPNAEIPAKEFLFEEAKYKAKNYTITRM